MQMQMAHAYVRPEFDKLSAHTQEHKSVHYQKVLYKQDKLPANASLHFLQHSISKNTNAISMEVRAEGSGRSYGCSVTTVDLQVWAIKPFTRIYIEFRIPDGSRRRERYMNTCFI